MYRFCQPGRTTPATKRHIVHADGRRVRRRDRDPPGQPQQVRVRPRAARDAARPAAVLGDRLPGRLRLRPRHPRARTATRSTCSCCSRTRRSRAAGSGSGPSACSGWRTRRAPTPRSSASRSHDPVLRGRARHLRAAASAARRDRALLRRVQDARAGEELATRGYEGRDAALREIADAKARAAANPDDTRTDATTHRERAQAAVGSTLNADHSSAY